jgi:GntR family transcriptional regulator
MLLNIIISNTGDKPIYQQIADQIKDHIMKGLLEESEPLPSIRSLAKDLNISVITTKRAYDELEKEGFIATIAGKGSYVAAQNKELLRESRIKIVEEKLSDAVIAAKSAELTFKELEEMLKFFCEEEK